MKGKLYLVPSLLGESTADVISGQVKEVIRKIDHFIAEDIRTARRYLIKTGISKSVDGLFFYVLNEHTSVKDLSSYLLPLEKGNDMAVLSEAGCPGVADPGSDIVRLAHQKGITVIPLTGPSSILLALMASGLNGQHFAFAGYLPVKKDERIQKIRQLENNSQRMNQTQIFIETPYRNNQLLADLTSACHPSTLLCIACDITLATQTIQTKSISDWKKKLPDLNKRPAVFLIHKE